MPGLADVESDVESSRPRELFKGVGHSSMYVLNGSMVPYDLVGRLKCH